MWAFGHTHYSCNFRDEQSGKLVIANQRGYKHDLEKPKQSSERVVVVEAHEESWGFALLNGDEKKKRKDHEAEEACLDRERIPTDSKLSQRSGFQRRVAAVMNVLRLRLKKY